MSTFDEHGDTIEGMARYLMAESGKSIVDVWEEVPSIYRVQFNTAVLADPDEKESEW